MRAIVRALRRVRGAWRGREVTDRPLGDSSAANYADKLEGFARFASNELAALVATLPIARGGRVLDAGCGTGYLLPALERLVGPEGLVVGLDLAAAHLAQANHRATALVQADFEHLPFRSRAFDAIWMVNALNHSGGRRAAIAGLLTAVRPGGSIVVVQSALVPDMMFAWDLRLEQVVRDACLRAYRDAYGLREVDTTDVRRLVGLFREADLAEVSVRTITIERLSPLNEGDERYLRQTVFEGYWGTKLRPYLTRADWNTLLALCDPASPHYALTRPDFHHIQTLTLVRGRVS